MTVAVTMGVAGKHVLSTVTTFSINVSEVQLFGDFISYIF
jgi:hypothetical protein